MSAPHHGDESELLRRLIKQGTPEEESSHSQGHLTADDEGDIVYRIGIVQNRIVLDYRKPIVWVAFGPSDARQLAAFLNEKADELERMA